jgi:DSBA-like thioredoxin domain
MKRRFAVTWDYRCPFARNAHEHLLTGLEAGADWDVTFVVFSLDQTHVEEGEKPVWDEPDRYPGLLANLAGVVVRDRLPDQFPAAHWALFAARHDQAMDLRDQAVVAKALDSVGVDSAAVLTEVETGWPLEVLKTEHSDAAGRLQVFGVPTFISADNAVFVRLMNRPLGDKELAISTIDRVLDLVDGWPELNEFKHTRILR